MEKRALQQAHKEADMFEKEVREGLTALVGQHLLSHVVFLTPLSISCRLPLYLMSSLSLSQVVFISILCRLHLYLMSSSYLHHVVFLSISGRLPFPAAEEGQGPPRGGQEGHQIPST